MPETVTRCTCSDQPGSCSATVAEHIRSAAEFVVSLSGGFDLLVEADPGRGADLDQKAALYRGILKLQGIDREDRAIVGLYVTSSAPQLGTMVLLGHASQAAAMATARLMVLAVPVIEELAGG